MSVPQTPQKPISSFPWSLPQEGSSTSRIVTFPFPGAYLTSAFIRSGILRVQIKRGTGGSVLTGNPEIIFDALLSQFRRWLVLALGISAGNYPRTAKLETHAD